MSDIIEIEQVPQSPNTSFDLIWVYNPLNEDFTHSHAGRPYTLKAKERKQFPEFLGRHLAKHLAKRICIGNHEAEIKKESEGQLTPDTAKSMPLGRVEEMFNWILDPIGLVPEDVGETQEETKEETVEEDITSDAPFKEATEEDKRVKGEEFVCDLCEQVCKSKAGLIAHQRKHK